MRPVNRCLGWRRGCCDILLVDTPLKCENRRLQLRACIPLSCRNTPAGTWHSSSLTICKPAHSSDGKPMQKGWEAGCITSAKSAVAFMHVVHCLNAGLFFLRRTFRSCGTVAHLRFHSVMWAKSEMWVFCPTWHLRCATFSHSFGIWSLGFGFNTTLRSPLLKRNNGKESVVGLVIYYIQYDTTLFRITLIYGASPAFAPSSYPDFQLWHLVLFVRDHR